MQVIKSKEDLDSTDLRLKSSYRQIQNECSDLRFLVEQKDLRLRKLEEDLTKAKSKLEKALSKTYAPSQNEIVEGLAQHEGREHNILRGGQEFEITHPLTK